MERMTYDVDGYYAVNGEGCYEDCGGNFAGPAIEKLAELETLAELGRMKLLALGIGQKVYVVRDGTIEPMVVKYVYFSSKPNRYYASNGRNSFNFREKALGRTVFTRLEDAERACRERRSGPV